jgi:REP element-mobilizing transposase RayT
MILYPELGHIGRLGNQLFQLAASIALAKKNGTDVRLPNNIYSREIHGQKCLLNNFKLTIELDTTSDFNEFHKFYDNTTELDTISKINDFKGAPDNTLLFGHFESEQFFLEYKNEICKQYKLNDDIEEFSINYLKDLKSQVGNKEIVAIHFRLGDAGVIYDNINWFKEFIYEVIDKYFSEEKYHFLVFTGGTREIDTESDLNYIKKIFTNKTKFSVCDINNTINELAIMKNSEHLIINWRSTFSWWAGYLNTNSNKKIVVPRLIPFNDNSLFNPDFFWSKDFIQYNKA